MSMDKQAKQSLLGKYEWERGWQQGSTLVEIVLAVAIFSLILSAALAVYNGGLQSWSRGFSALDRQQNARIAMDEIVRELRYARSLEGLEDENVLPLYRHGTEGQHGGESIHYTNVDGQKSEFRFNENKKIITLKVAKGSHNEISYDVAGLDFFRYIPRGNLPAGGNAQGGSPMLLVRLKVQGDAKIPGQPGEAPYILQNVVRLQNLPLPGDDPAT